MYSPTYLFRDKSGIYYFRYAVPQTARKLDPELPREIKISVKTKRKMLALGRAKYLWLKTQQLIRSDCQGTFRGMEKGLSIGELIRRYRDYIASMEEYV